MNRLLKAVVVIVVLSLPFWLGAELLPAAGALRATVIETVTGETPEAKIADYVNALAREDKEAALAVWELPGWNSVGLTKLVQRRQTVTAELLAAGIESTYEIVAVEWWRTCCEPSVIADPRSAGGARIEVRLRDRDGRLLSYRIDVFTRGGAYWGAAMAYPPREWSLRDVYRTDQAPLFWPFGDGSGEHAANLFPSRPPTGRDPTSFRQFWSLTT